MDTDSNIIIRSVFTFAKLHNSKCYKTGQGPWVKSRTQFGVFIINAVYAKKYSEHPDFASSSEQSNKQKRDGSGCYAWIRAYKTITVRSR